MDCAVIYSEAALADLEQKYRRRDLLTAWQLPFLLYTRDQEYIKGFEEIAVGFGDIKDASRPRNHRKLRVRNLNCAAIGHGDLKRATGPNRFAQRVCRHAQSVFLVREFAILATKVLALLPISKVRRQVSSIQHRVIQPSNELRKGAWPA